MTKILVRKVEAKKESTFLYPPLVLSFVFGMALGGAVVSRDISLPKAEGQQNLASVTLITSTSTPPSTRLEIIDAAGQGELTQNSSPLSVRDTDRAKVQENTQLLLLIQDKEILIERLLQQVEQLRSRGVSIVSEFESQCGAWISDCGDAFTSLLNKNNSDFLEIETRLKIEEQALSQLKDELIP